MNLHKKCLLLIVGLFVLMIVGCGPRYKLYQIEGVVQFQGKPVPAGISIEFKPEAGQRSSIAMTDSEGHFALQYTRDSAGVEPGKHKIILLPPMAGGMGDETFNLSEELLTALAKYDEENTPLNVEVKKNDKNMIITME